MTDHFLSEDEIARRLPLWCALAELFLDNEIQIDGYRAIARVAQESGFTAEETRRILEAEVFPAFISNLSDIAGEWAGFHPDDVRELVLGVRGQPGGRCPRNPPVAMLWRPGFMATEWPRIEAAFGKRDPDLSRLLVKRRRRGMIWLCLSLLALVLTLAFRVL